MASTRRVPRSLIALFAALGAVSMSAPASAEVDTFYRFEEIATANWVVIEDCPNGTQARTLVTVIAGREFESPDLEDVNTFATVRIRGRNCDFESFTDFGTGPVTYTSSPSLQEAHVSGTIELRSGSVATIDVTWEGTGSLETNVNPTRFPGFVGTFTSKLREAVATGTIVVDGDTLVSGPTENAEIETLEDRNRRLPSEPSEEF